MKTGPAGLPAITEPWATKDIIYVACMSPLFLMALAEWFLWILAFNYCLWCCFRKANNWSTRFMSMIMAFFFTCFRGVFLPVMIFTLPMPGQITQYYPTQVVNILQWFAFWAFSGLLTIPWLFCVYQLVTNVVGRRKKIKYALDEFSAPKVVIVMPCYREKPEILLRTIDSIVDCEYPPSCMHVFLSFDGDEIGELYLKTIEALGVPVTITKYPRSLDIVYRNCRVTVSRFPHGGKRNCQKMSFKLIDRVYEEYLKRNDNLFILFIDSDCILDRVCIQNFLYEMELKPGSKGNMLAMTGVITSTADKNSLLTVLQDMEYIHGQLFERSVESGCGAVTCLPGALTILRFSAFRKLSHEYFKDRSGQIEDVFDYSKAHLGEDRFLTHLFMIAAKERYQIQMNPAAFCKTEAVLDFKTLLKQRRRWFLGFITNEACMLTDIRLWRKYPLLLLIRFAQNTIRTTALLFFIMVISLLSTSQKVQNLPVGFIAVSLGLNWVLMIYFAAALNRWKILAYPLMFVVNPLFNWLYMVYGIFTATQRTWGGPRADATKADEKTSPAEALAQAKDGGDELNVDIETFKREVSRRKSLKGQTYEPMSLLPAAGIEGQFRQATPLPGGWYSHESIQGSNLTLPETYTLAPGQQPMSLYPRTSTDSGLTVESSANSFCAPRRVESYLDNEGLQQYHQNQADIAAERPAGGQHVSNVYPSYIPYQYRGAVGQTRFKTGYSDSSRSSSAVSSAASTPLASSPVLRPASPFLGAQPQHQQHQPVTYQPQEVVHDSRSDIPPPLDLGQGARSYAQRAVQKRGPASPSATANFRANQAIPLEQLRSPLSRKSFARRASEFQDPSPPENLFATGSDENLRDHLDDSYFPARTGQLIDLDSAPVTLIDEGRSTDIFDEMVILHTSLDRPLASHPAYEHFIGADLPRDDGGEQDGFRSSKKERKKLSKDKWRK